jgi:hypothetical protein
MGTGTSGRVPGWRIALAVGGAVALAGCAGASADEPSAIEERDRALAEAPRFVEPAIGAELPSTFTVEIDPGPVDLTGDTVPADAGGRFHLLVDRPCLENAEPFPPLGADHLVFAPGATSAEVELAPGAHDLCLQFGNAFDVAFYATDTITVRVLE